jgi:hypothetical protein
MIGILRQGTLIALAAVFSWWICLRAPASLPLILPFAPEILLPVSITPVLEPPDSQDVQVASAQEVEQEEPEETEDPVEEPEQVEAQAPAEAAELREEPEPVAIEAAASLEVDESEPPDAAELAPPPPEAGDPEGDAEALEAAPPDTSEEASPEGMMQNERLLESAERELAGEARLGFSTVLIAAPEDQIAIAHYFGEELVLVPKSALDESAERRGYFRLSPGAGQEVESVSGAPRLEQYRQYRDLFDYEYARLPAPLRALRRSVLSRGEIYLFAALIPLREWALVVGRREEALAQSTRSAAEVRRFTLRYEHGAAGGFDVRVREILFTDGRRFTPPVPH